MPDRSLYYNRKGRPITLHDWALSFEETGDRIVKTAVFRRRGDQVVVSTVWVGIDRSFSANPHAKPLIFESVILGGPLDGEVVYYSNEEEAQQGHSELVSLHKKMKLNFVLWIWMFFRHSIPMLRESVIHPRSAAIARTALVLWTAVVIYSVMNFFQSLFVGHNYPWAPFNFAMLAVQVGMFTWALRGHRWLQGQIRARKALIAEKEQFEKMMDGD
jgi:hypothetical protein